MAIALSICPSRATAQADIENVIVETYYISDGSDATDVTGGGLPEGSVTYRVFLDLCEGCGLRAVYGDANHVLSITSTAPFFNHADRGRTYGHLLNNSALSEGTTPLDSYLSLGRGSSQRLGVTKELDADGSEVGGANNDGGSALVPGGLLVNSTPEMGPALTEVDGLASLNGVPGVPPGFLASGEDPAVAFDDATSASEFVSLDCRIACSSPGVVGVTAENLVLIAQLTTTGELTFLLNVEIERPDGSVVKYVATGDTLLSDETLNGLLVYPPDCGCTDPDFLEFDPLAGCDDGSCATPIVFGCLDPAACNYSTSANFNVPELCCYGPTNCNGLDITLVCPTVGMEETAATPVVHAFPNPVDAILRVRVDGIPQVPSYGLFDATGRCVLEGTWTTAPDEDGYTLDVAALSDGVYHLRIHTGDRTMSTRVVKGR
jgi:hypothetical protein